MSTTDRRRKILKELENSEKPISASFLAKKFGVSRQIIVGDVALLRAENSEIISTNRGYVLNKKSNLINKLCVSHGKEQIKEELYTIVDYGGKVLDVIVNHPIYGEIKVDLHLSNRLEVDNFMSEIFDKENIPLSVLTNDEHIHTIETDSIENFIYIEKKLEEIGIIKK